MAEIRGVPVGKRLEEGSIYGTDKTQKGNTD